MAENHILEQSADYVVSLALFENVNNCNELRQSAMSGLIEAALVKPATILDKFQVFCASNKALHNSLHGKQVTRALHSEILYCLSPTKNISGAFGNFGISDKDSCVLIVEVKKPAESKFSEICEQVKGDLVELCDLDKKADKKLIKKIYKVSDLELTVGSLLEAVVGRMASKEFVTI